LPWWVFLRDGEGYRPVRGWRPHPGYRVTGIQVRKSDGVELQITSGDGERAWIVTPVLSGS
jgi:hypothetical protein